MAKAKRRIFNYRPMCFAALALILGIIIAEAIYGENPALVSVPTVFAAVALVLLCIFKRTRAFSYIPLAFLIGFAAMSLSGVAYDAKLKYGDEKSVNVNMSGTVSGMIEVGDDETLFYLHNAYVDGEPLGFDVKIIMSKEIEPDFNAGDIVHVYGSVIGASHKKFDSAFADAIAGDEGYVLFCYYVNKLSEGKLTFPRNLQHSIKTLFYSQLDPETASICTALVTGDKFGMDDALKSEIAASGLSHILAVSGLHITTLATALYFVLKKLKMKPWVSFSVVTVLTFLYAMICSFTASALRAFVMSAVFNFASSFGRKRDNLSALSLGAIIILTFRPTALFEMGFLLSFSSMLGIFLFFKSFNDLAQRAISFVSPKRRIGKRTAELVCVTLSASVMSYPFVAYFFGCIPTLQILSNIVFVPYMMTVYVALLAGTAFSLVTTLHPVVYAMKILLFPFVKYVQWVGGLSFAYIDVPSLSVPAIVCYLLTAILLSRFTLLPRKDKLRGGIAAAATSVALCAIIAAL